MDETTVVWIGLDLLCREAALFAAAGFLLLGVGDVAVDLLWFGWSAGRRLRARRAGGRPTVNRLAAPPHPGRLAVFVPAWDESAVIEPMLRHALAAFDHQDYRIYVGCYPNDPATAAAAGSIADSRLRIVLGEEAGPTTKAACLNRIWQEMLRDEAAGERRFTCIVLHDAEDVVHSAELRLLDALVRSYDLVQLPVVPLIDPNSRWVAGHYADEFAEAHGKELVVRAAIGAALPSAGVGCGFARGALDRLAAAAGGAPFDADSLTEDYELGLRLARIGGTAAFIRIRADAERPPVATREYFPATMTAAVAQKSRWVRGIALAGWDRLGWWGGAGERWMRLRDRQSVLAALLLFAGYSAFLLWAVLQLARPMTGYAPAPAGEPLESLLAANLALLCWRLAMRFAFVARCYGVAEGLRAIPRAALGNLIAMLAARRALLAYLASPRGARPAWEKTRHFFPARAPAE